LHVCAVEFIERTYVAVDALLSDEAVDAAMEQVGAVQTIRAAINVVTGEREATS
jgi:hypothetical protein